MGAVDDRDEGGLTMGLYQFTSPKDYYANAMDTTAGRANAGLYKYGQPTSEAGYKNLLELLMGKGRVDPRLLARAQALNARSTQQQQDAARAGAARSGMGGGGLNQALQAALGAAGSNRSANLNYQDIADSYARNQENLGLMNQLVVQPGLANRQMGMDYSKQVQAKEQAHKNGVFGFSGSLFGAAGKAAGA